MKNYERFVLKARKHVLNAVYQHTSELITAPKSSHKQDNKDLSRLRYLSTGVRVNTRYINSTGATPSSGAQDLCESRGGRPGFPSLISLRFLWTYSNTQPTPSLSNCISSSNLCDSFFSFFFFLLLFFSGIASVCPYLLRVYSLSLSLSLSLSIKTRMM